MCCSTLERTFSINYYCDKSSGFIRLWNYQVPRRAAEATTLLLIPRGENKRKKKGKEISEGKSVILAIKLRRLYKEISQSESVIGWNKVIGWQQNAKHFPICVRMPFSCSVLSIIFNRLLYT